ncbi:hypothetical protein [Novosphingobium profundi]|uniref:hypothetical protein n=1 Tax=Novosphingobium profundi TaxID=1774954 RepID=UPI001FE35F9F|nr:hypothetical protein [Novosphingobium profundi]
MAKAAFDSRYRAIRADMEERGIAGRIIDETIEKAVGIVDEAVEVAEEHPALVGGTLAALMLWIFRNPLIAWIGSVLRTDGDKEEEIEHG